MVSHLCVHGSQLYQVIHPLPNYSYRWTFRSHHRAQQSCHTCCQTDQIYLDLFHMVLLRSYRGALKNTRNYHRLAPQLSRRHIYGHYCRSLVRCRTRRRRHRVRTLLACMVHTVHLFDSMCVQQRFANSHHYIHCEYEHPCPNTPSVRTPHYNDTNSRSNTLQAPIQNHIVFDHPWNAIARKHLLQVGRYRRNQLARMGHCRRRRTFIDHCHRLYYWIYSFSYKRRIHDGVYRR